MFKIQAVPHTSFQSTAANKTTQTHILPSANDNCYKAAGVNWKSVKDSWITIVISQ